MARCNVTISNCLAAAVQLASPTQHSCSECQSGATTVIAVQSITPIPLAEGERQPASPVSAYPAVTCLLNPSLRAAVNNCRYYSLLTNAPEYGCLTCQMGLQGTVQNAVIGDNFNLINSCSVITNCTNTRYEGLDIRVQSFYSCHQCSGSNIPKVTFLNNNFLSLAAGSASTECVASSTTTVQNCGAIFQIAAGVN